MTQRLDARALLPQFYAALYSLEAAAQGTGVDPVLYELVKIRASQLNGCAYCLDMHLRDARAAGEFQRRLDVLSAWREASGLFSQEERAALDLAERVTLIAEGGVPQDVWDTALSVLGPEGVAQVLAATVTINTWNRLAIAVRQELPA